MGDLTSWARRRAWESTSQERGRERLGCLFPGGREIAAMVTGDRDACTRTWSLAVQEGVQLAIFLFRFWWQSNQF